MRERVFVCAWCACVRVVRVCVCMRLCVREREFVVWTALSVRVCVSVRVRVGGYAVRVSAYACVLCASSSG